MKLGVDFYYSDLPSCPRCGETHSHVLFKRMPNSQDPEMKWYGSCPRTEAPIFSRMAPYGERRPTEL